MNFIIAAIAVERITEILISGKIFDGMRGAVFECAFPPENVSSDHISRRIPCSMVNKNIFLFLAGMLSCGLCTSVWVAGFAVVYLAVAVPATSGGISDIGSWNGIIIKWMCVTGLSNFLHVIYSLVYKGRIHALDINVAMKEEEANGGMGRESDREGGSQEQNQE